MSLIDAKHVVLISVLGVFFVSTCAKCIWWFCSEFDLWVVCQDINLVIGYIVWVLHSVLNQLLQLICMSSK